MHPKSQTLPQPLHVYLPGPDSWMLPIPKGSFWMGDDNSRYQAAKPAHQVEVDSFYFSKYVVTNAQYAAFLNAYGAGKVQAGKYKGQQMVHLHRWGVQQENGKWYPATGYEDHPSNVG